MDQYKAAPLKKLKGFWRVDGVSQVAESEKGLKVKIVLSRLRDDFTDPYSIDARLGTRPVPLTLHPRWLCILTIGSVWHSGSFHSKPEPLPYSLTVDTTQAVNYTYHIAIKLGDAWTKAGIAAADFLPKDNYEDLYATLYSLVRIVDNPTYKWLVIPASELLRFYMGVSGRLLTSVLRGETNDLIQWAPEEQQRLNAGKIDLYENKKLKELEIQVLGRALASEAFKDEMFSVNKRITAISATNSLKGTKSALAIDSTFPFKGITNLSVSGQAMRLANDQAIFAMEIHHCTFPLEFTSLTVHGLGSTRAASDEKGQQGTHKHFVAHDPDDVDDELEDTATDATLQRRELPQIASPFAGSSDISIEYDRTDKVRSGSSLSSASDADSNGQSMGDGDYKDSSQGNVGVDEYKTPAQTPSLQLLEFFAMLNEFREKTRPLGWISKSIAINGQTSVEELDEDSDQSDQTKDIVTFFPFLEKKRKWQLVASGEHIRARQLACIEVSSSKRSGGFFYILEIELKDQESGQCTAIIRGRDYRKLTTSEINKLLKLTCYLTRWPKLVNDKWTKKAHEKLATKVSQSIIITKLVHPRNRRFWSGQLIAHIKSWLKTGKFPPMIG